MCAHGCQQAQPHRPVQHSGTQGQSQARTEDVGALWWLTGEGALSRVVCISCVAGNNITCDWCRCGMMTNITNAASMWCRKRHRNCRVLAIKTKTDRQGNTLLLSKVVPFAARPHANSRPDAARRRGDRYTTGAGMNGLWYAACTAPEAGHGSAAISR